MRENIYFIRTTDTDMKKILLQLSNSIYEIDKY